jgi:hypothetical protein
LFAAFQQQKLHGRIKFSRQYFFPHGVQDPPTCVGWLTASVSTALITGIQTHAIRLGLFFLI